MEISDKELIGRSKSGNVTIEFQMGPLRDRLLVGEREYEVPRGRHGWSHINDPRGGAGRVRYDGWRDRLFIDASGGPMRLPSGPCPRGAGRRSPPGSASPLRRDLGTRPCRPGPPGI